MAAAKYWSTSSPTAVADRFVASAAAKAQYDTPNEPRFKFFSLRARAVFFL